ncbi:uncharacterized protein LOC119319625 [Triticum dicoccoides]|uniref:VQ domain-containing protein n=1 Tax=Triticum turgidum subsp. durum TaxID=4567 RepID=A0A9R0Y6M8_TRITD|nr:uncharacterized protein LOC119319625 [Triticum dicoccoides]VAI49226.1 unnamed protein product [Triticum turgidum subsp. durum]
MYSCDGRDRSATAARIMESSAKYQPCNTAATRTAGGQVPADAQQQQPSPRRARRKHSASASRRSSTTVVATDVSNFRAMVQELTGFPPAAIFRPLPRRAHAAGRSLAAAAAHGCGGALQGHRSDAATVTGSVPAVVQPLAHPPQCAPPGVFDGLPDLGSPEFDTWPDLSFE